MTSLAPLMDRLVAEVVIDPSSGLACLINPDGPEAAEAISSLLKALEFYANEHNWRTPSARPCGHLDGSNVLADRGNKARAALNSDAPLSIGEGL